MATTFKHFLIDSIQDKGIFKAIFIIGIPGAGKSYTAEKLKGGVEPRIVNTDKASEYLAGRKGMELTSETWKLFFSDDARRITKGALLNYANGMLPLFIDGTSNDASNILHRAGILESLGYDVGMVFIDTPLDTAMRRAELRAKKIGRTVDPEFIENVHQSAEENRKYFQSKFGFFITVKNDDNELTDEALNAAFKKTASFFTSKVENPVGQRYIKTLKDNKQSYLVPTILSKEELIKKIEGWYKL